MSTDNEPFEVLLVEEQPDAFAELSHRPADLLDVTTTAGVFTACFHGFDIDDRPLVTGIPAIPREIVVARTTVPLLRRQIDSTVVALCEQGDPRRPIILGVLREQSRTNEGTMEARPSVSARVDDDRLVLTAEREIVLRCGNASITLTRAGKVLVKGSYVLSRSTGYNKIKGAAVDIN